MTAGSLMAGELAEQPQVLGRLVDRHVADRDQVQAVLPGQLLPGRLAGTVLLARGSSDNVAVYGRYLTPRAETGGVVGAAMVAVPVSRPRPVRAYTSGIARIRRASCSGSLLPSGACSLRTCGAMGSVCR